MLKAPWRLAHSFDRENRNGIFFPSGPVICGLVFGGAPSGAKIIRPEGGLKYLLWHDGMVQVEMMYSGTLGTPVIVSDYSYHCLFVLTFDPHHHFVWRLKHY